MRIAREARTVFGMTKATAATADPEYFKVSEVARHLNVSDRHVYDLIAERELEGVNFGTGRRGIRVTAASLTAFKKRRSAA